MRRFFVTISSLFIVMSLAVYTAQASKIGNAVKPKKTEKKVVIIVADRIGFKDIADPSLKNISSFISNGSVGLMNTRVLGGHNPVAAHATIGAGVRAIGVFDASYSEDYNKELESGVPAAFAYSTKTAFKPPSQGIVNLGIAKLQKANITTSWKAVPGVLGSALESSGLSSSVIGNSDADGQFHRESVLILMNTAGYLRHGDVSTSTLEIDYRAPFGYSSNIPYTIELFKKEYKKRDVVLVDFGDTARADYFMDSATEDAWLLAKNRAVKNLDIFLGLVEKTIDKDNTMLMLLVPTPSLFAYNNRQSLTPIIISAPDFENGEILMSRGTRRVGLVTNLDIAPTILSFLGAEIPGGFLGVPVSSSSKTRAPIDFLLAFHDRDAAVEMNSWIVKFIVIFQFIAFVLIFITALAIKNPQNIYRRIAFALLTPTICMDLAALLIAWVYTKSAFGLVAAIVVALALICIAVRIVKKTEAKIALIAALYTFIIVIDQLAGAPLAMNALLGYYPQIGARYYGIGNEYMGFLVSAPVLLLALMLDASESSKRAVRLSAPPVFIVCLAVVAAPDLGANVGGFISCFAAYLLMSMVIYDKKITFRLVAATGMIIAAAVAALALADAFLFKGTESHLGQLVDRIATGGWMEFFNIAYRKLDTNLRLMTVSWWSALVISLAVISLAVRHMPVTRFRELFARRPYLYKSFTVSLAGALVAFLANDSGLTASATALLLPLGAAFMLLFSDNNQS